MSLLVKVLPLFQDNFCYYVRRVAAKQGVLIDPADPKTILKAVTPDSVGAVIYTHKHWDHAGQSPLLSQLLPKRPFFSGYPDNQHIIGTTHPVQKDTQIPVLPDLNVQFIKTPCHTAGHVCLLIRGVKSETEWIEEDTVECGDAVFTGDTLFLSGAGKFFEGDEHDMFKSLGKLKQAVPDKAAVFPGHQYTMKNLAWASSLQGLPRQEIQDWMSSLKDVKWSIPGRFESERKLNPFLLADTPQKLKYFRQHKNNFK